MVLPLFIPVITLISSLLFIKTSGRIYYSKVSIFAYSFLVLLYAELIIRYTGINEIVKNIFLFSPCLLYTSPSPRDNTTSRMPSSALKNFFLMIRRPPRSTHRRSSAASDVYKRQFFPSSFVC